MFLSDTDLDLHKSDQAFCISRTSVAGVSWKHPRRPVPQVFPGGAVCADTQRCYNSDTADRCWPNCWRSSSRGYTVDICIHRNNGVLPGMVSVVKQE